jgi:hypothetical protein
MSFVMENNIPIKLKFKLTNKRYNNCKINIAEPIKVLVPITKLTNRSSHTRLPNKDKAVLLQWFITHIHNPYPSHEEKYELANRTSLTIKQIDTWFTNRRSRFDQI